MTPPYLPKDFYPTLVTFLAFHASYPLLRSTLNRGGLLVASQGPSAFTVPLWPSLSNRKRLSFYSPRLPTVGRLPFPPMIETPLFFKKSSVVRLLSYVPGSFSPRGVSHRPCSFGLNFVPPLLCTLLLPFSAQAKSVSRRHSP
ncbi:hypothetical protein TNCT_553651 [Trichonephila clavata]|uniref:Uncharacterized protein n=1 Tax=Trichonephila clavata TaxID=2740835 RepID=A0A8X6HL30_TRICU|nr:hypothetical protein TNCT_553651 [Trichonephila clavata]